MYNSVYSLNDVKSNCPARLNYDKQSKLKTNWIKNSILFKIKSVLIFIRFLSSKNKVIPENPKCVLIATGGNLGGTIISLPLIEGVRNKWPLAHLAIITNVDVGKELLKLLNLGDSHYVLPPITIFNVFKNRKIINSIRKIKPDIFITNHNQPLENLSLLLSKTVRIGHVGHCVSGRKLPYHGIYNIKTTCTKGENWLSSYERLALSFNCNINNVPSIEIEFGEVRCVKHIKKEYKVLAIQAGVWEQQRFKQWPIESLVKTCLILANKNPIHIIIFGVAGQESSYEIFRRSIPDSIQISNLVNKICLRDTISAISKCSATITNDSGLMHLSAAVKTPTIAIYGMTDPNITWCYGKDPRHRIVHRNDIYPCYSNMPWLVNSCGYKHCLLGINPSYVAKAITEVWREHKFNTSENIN